jgi:hypothetical protein
MCVRAVRVRVLRGFAKSASGQPTAGWLQTVVKNE